MKEETVDYRFGCLERGADYVDSQQTFLTAELEMEYLSLKLSRIVRWTELVLGAGLLKLESTHDQKILHVPSFRDTRIGVGVLEDLDELFHEALY